MYANGLYRTFAALAIAWAFILTFNTGCDVESPGDDDDVPGDDDDNVETVECEISSFSDYLGVHNIDNSVPLEQCGDEDTLVDECDHMTTHEGEHSCSYWDPEGKIVGIDYIFDVDADTDEFFCGWYAEDGTIGYTLPNGTYTAYEGTVDNPGDFLTTLKVEFKEHNGQLVLFLDDTPDYVVTGDTLDNDEDRVILTDVNVIQFYGNYPEFLILE